MCQQLAGENCGGWWRGLKKILCTFLDILMDLNFLLQVRPCNALNAMCGKLVMDTCATILVSAMTVLCVWKPRPPSSWATIRTPLEVKYSLKFNISCTVHAVLFSASTTISRICGKTDNKHFGHECHYYKSSDGHDIRCYCDEDLCNGAASISTSFAISLSAISLLLCKFLW
jgi:hypothetical protein